MPVFEDDFGQSRMRRTHRGFGVARPPDAIGSTVADLQAENTPRLAGNDVLTERLLRSSLDMSSVLPQDGVLDRRSCKVVYDNGGREVNFHRTSFEEQPKKTGIRTMDFIPLPKKGLLDGSKRCFEWTQRPTGPNNTMSWEDPPTPGARPSHPVSSAGLVDLTQKRGFPAVHYPETGIPPPKNCVESSGGARGGWAVDPEGPKFGAAQQRSINWDGAPGRGRLHGPWDSQAPRKPGVLEVETAFVDAARKHFPDMNYKDASGLLQWHLDPHKHVDPPPRRKPLRGMSQGPLAAGKPTGAPRNGASLSWAEQTQSTQLMGPHTAR